MLLYYKNDAYPIELLVELILHAKSSSKARVCKVLKIIHNPKNAITFVGAEIELEREFLTIVEDPANIMKTIL